MLGGFWVPVFAALAYFSRRSAADTTAAVCPVLSAPDWI